MNLKFKKTEHDWDIRLYVVSDDGVKQVEIDGDCHLMLKIGGSHLETLKKSLEIMDVASITFIFDGKEDASSICVNGEGEE